jgi:DME family drug/metabolite transporter
VVRHDHLADGDSLLLVAWLALAGTAAAYAAFVHGLDRTSASTAGTLSLAEPLLAAAAGVLVLHERLSPSATLGCLILLAGLAVVTLVDTAHRSDAPATRRPPTAGEVSAGTGAVPGHDRIPG